MPGRQFVGANGYRYGFNGKESDDEITGSDNSYDFGARIYDPRLGRFYSVDPDASKYYFMSPYCYAGNNGIFYLDKNGRGPIPYGKIILESFKYILSTTKSSAVLNLSASAKGGAITPSASYKYSLGLALDSYGNYAIISSQSVFVDVFGHGANTNGKTGVKEKQWYLGNPNVSASVDIGINAVPHVKGLAGKGSNFDIDASLGEKISFSETYDLKTGEWVGGSVSIGVGTPGGGFGWNTNNSTVFGFAEIDAQRTAAVSTGVMGKYISLISTANPLTNYSLSFEYKNDGKTITGDYIIKQTTTKINKDGTTTTVTSEYGRYRAFEFKRGGKDYWQTENVVSEVEEKK